jgi:hypothetical protein
MAAEGEQVCGQNVRARAEKEDHARIAAMLVSALAGRRYLFLLLHQGVREAHFGAVHCAIAGGFDDGEKRCEVGVCDDLIDRILIVLVSMQVEMQWLVNLRTFNPSILSAGEERVMK